MKAARITSWGETPKYVDIPEPPAPSESETQIKVLSVGIHRLVRMQATGTHFGAKKLPHIPGTDGIGRRVSDGHLVYFTSFWEGGSLAEIINVPTGSVSEVPEGADPVSMAGLLNPAMSSWMALKLRTTNLPPNFNVLILGATTVSGIVAIGLARKLGAGKVFGVARNEKAMKEMGYDKVVVLKNPPESTDFSGVAEDVDVILDYIYGKITIALFTALKPNKPVQYLEVGTVAEMDMQLPGALLRSKDITLRGAAPGSYSEADAAKVRPAMIEAVAEIKDQKFKVVDLKYIESEWKDEKTRMVVKVAED